MLLRNDAVDIYHYVTSSDRATYTRRLAAVGSRSWSWLTVVTGIDCTPHAREVFRTVPAVHNVLNLISQKRINRSCRREMILHSAPEKSCMGRRAVHPSPHLSPSISFPITLRGRFSYCDEGNVGHRSKCRLTSATNRRSTSYLHFSV